eukprot:EG_transcript_5908
MALTTLRSGPPKFDVLGELQVSDVIPRCVDSLPAIGRIPGRGAATLISIVEADTGDYGVLLTTIFAVGSRQEAGGLTVIFHEHEVGPAVPRPMECRLRPDKCFHSPPAPPSADLSNPNQLFTDDWLPYCLVGCDMTGSRGGSLATIAPVAFPITTAMLDPLAVEVGAAHLAVERPVAAAEPKYALGRVDARSAHLLRYSVDAVLTGFLSTGDPLFDPEGRLVAVNHHSRNFVQGICVRSIAEQLFANDVMGQVTHRLLDRDPDLEDRFTQHGEPLPVPPGIYWERVWDTWHREDDIPTLVHLTHAFPYSLPLVTKAIERMSIPANKDKLSQLADLRGVWPLLDLLERHPYNSTLASRVMAALGNASLSPAVRAQLTHFNAVPALLACLKHFEQEEMIHQWATFIVLNLCSDGEDNKTWFLALGGYAQLAGALGRWPENPHLVAWAVRLLGVLCCGNADHEDFVHREGGTALVLQYGAALSTHALVMEGVIFTLHVLVKQSAPITEYLVRQGAPELWSAALELFVMNEEAVLCVMATLQDALRHSRSYAAPLVAMGFDRLLLTTTCRFPTSVDVIRSASVCFSLLGMDALEQFKHSQVINDVLLTFQQSEPLALVSC